MLLVAAARSVPLGAIVSKSFSQPPVGLETRSPLVRELDVWHALLSDKQAGFRAHGLAQRHPAPQPSAQPRCASTSSISLPEPLAVAVWGEINALSTVPTATASAETASLVAVHDKAPRGFGPKNLFGGLIGVIVGVSWRIKTLVQTSLGALRGLMGFGPEQRHSLPASTATAPQAPNTEPPQLPIWMLRGIYDDAFTCPWSEGFFVDR